MNKKPFFLFASTNPNKVKEVSQYFENLELTVEGLPEFGNNDKYEESGRTFSEIAQSKALHYHSIYGMPTLADDSGLVIDALNGEPGILSSRYLGADVPHSKKIADILKRMKGLPTEERKAHFVCSLALVLERRVYCCITKMSFGHITEEPQGSSGFGYDPIFFSPDLKCTFAEASLADKNNISHRGRAVLALVRLLETHADLRSKLKLS